MAAVRGARGAVEPVPVVQGAVLLVAFTFTLVNLMVDLLYAWIDPRVRYD